VPDLLAEPSPRVPPSIALFEVSSGETADIVSAIAADVRGALTETGAALVRGFAALSVSEFADVAVALIDEVVTDNGEHEPVDPSGTVQVPVAFSPDRKLLWHNENSFNCRWPQTLVFSPTVVATTGGRTPLTDSRRLLEVLDPGIVARFRDHGIAYVRRFGNGIGLPWQRVLGTESRTAAEKRAAADGVELAWGPGETLATRAVRPAVIDHPLTGESAFFAQPAHWHPACLDDETREALVDVFGPDNLPRDCRFGDGSVIPDSMMHDVLAAYASIEQSFEWVAGDVLAIDNVLSAHARDPYTGPRRLLVAMGDEHQFTGPTGPETRPTPL
jgi:hypothetical protein